MAYKAIEDYGVIGDMKTVALAGTDGAIDFFCFPNFDSPSAFAAILDDKKGGSFAICPGMDNTRQSQLYVPDTNVLLTRFTVDENVLEIVDFMPIGDDDAPSKIVRIVRCLQGATPFAMRCLPAFDYARAPHAVTLGADAMTATFSDHGKQALCLHSTMPMQAENGEATASHSLNKGESACFMLNCASQEIEKFDNRYAEILLEQTIAFWRAWTAQITYRGRWRDMVQRSALTLKLLTSRHHGSIIAAPTFGLPEAIGAARNWDYRYCWIRDSAFTIYALVRLGIHDEATAFTNWVERLYAQACETNGALQVMYRIDGGRDIEEFELPHLEGYKRSLPVRIGNAASEQFQLDIYGELMDAIAMADRHITKISYDAWQNVIRSADFVCDNWRKPDAGIWEFRDGQREFLHSRLMCWVALDRALRLAREESLPSEIKRWLDTRAEIYNDIFTSFWNDDLKSFVQHKGATNVDASVLLMPLVDFIGPTDPRWLSTLKAVGEKLASDALVHRYRLKEIDLDSIDASEEGSFTACSFWYISCLARAGRRDEAWLLFSKMAGYANHLGLYAEQMGNDGRQLGNFPQALTHLALINAVFALEEGTDQRSEDWRPH